MARVSHYLARAEEALAVALADALDEENRAITAALLAGQVIATQRILATENRRRIVSGRSADEIHPEAVADADLAFALLHQGPRASTGIRRDG